MMGSGRPGLLWRGAGAVALAVTLAACGGGVSTASTTTAEVNPPGDIPDNQVFIAFDAPTGVFTLQVPEGWSQTQDGAATVLTDKLNSIRIEEAAAASAPTVQSVQTDIVPAIASNAVNYEAGTVEVVQRRSGEAILITYRADSPPDSVTGKVVHLDVERYEFWHAGKQVSLTLSGPQGADNVDPWRIVTDSLRWLG